MILFNECSVHLIHCCLLNRSLYQHAFLTKKKRFFFSFLYIEQSCDDELGKAICVRFFLFLFVLFFSTQHILLFFIFMISFDERGCEKYIICYMLIDMPDTFQQTFPIIFICVRKRLLTNHTILNIWIFFKAKTKKQKF